MPKNESKEQDKIIVDRITSLISAKNVMGKDFAIAIGVTPSTISEWKGGRQSPISHINKIADYFDVSVDYLLGRTDNPKADWSQEKFPSEEIVYVPIIASVAAGFEKSMQELSDGDRQEVPASILRGYNRSDIFAFIVSGDSMYPKFLDGDRVIVVRQDSVDSGDTAIVAYDDFEEGTIKKVSYESNCDYIDLIPLNPKYNPVRLQGEQLQGCRIIGKVIYLFRAV